ncbi:MAG TPA: FCD domain-containing protein [Candidatus Dormibacteraeota bacterium]|nr:FCD domain-containing protein [Candidatus Dormibacteraeota bacterium]
MNNKDLLVQLRSRRAETLSSLVAEELERMIIRGELQAGDRINESALAQVFSISRGPIREACRSLEKSNLVRVVTNRGVFVREMSVVQATEIYDVRAHLFGLAGRLAASRIVFRDVVELRAMVAEMQQAKDIDTYYPLNVAFHARLVELSGNHRVAELYCALSKELHLFRRRGLVQGDSMVLSNQEHMRIVEALRDHNCDLSEHTMVDHILAGKARLLERVKEQGPEGSEPGLRATKESE